jgi:hypothetical protein
VDEKSDMAFTAHGVQAIQVSSKSFGNERYFTHEAEKVFPPCRASQWGEVNETAYLTLPARDLQPLQVLSKSANKEEHFTLNDITAFRPFSSRTRKG